jgi:hypothetical protein
MKVIRFPLNCPPSIVSLPSSNNDFKNSVMYYLIFPLILDIHFFKVLKQWGQAVTIFLASYAFRTSIFIIACIWNKNSFPALLPDHRTLFGTKYWKGTFDLKFAQMLCYFFCSIIKTSCNPPKNNTSGCFPWANISAIVGTKFSFSYFLFSWLTNRLFDKWLNK